jgi:outer membrane protein OmpA-like peptidoglycan-associated protein
MKKILTIALLFLSVLANAQESILQQANRQFDTRAFAKAISLYEQVLEDKSLPEKQAQVVKANTAYAYSELGDFAKSESIYRGLLTETGTLSGPMAVHYLHYAKVLANVGKSKESEQYFAQYQKTKGSNTADASAYSKGKISYKVESLSINTAESEFSPSYFKDGLVYVSGKASSLASSESVKKGYLDLFYVANRNDIRSVTTINPDGTEAEIKTSGSNGGRAKHERVLGNDAYTLNTSNDSKTIGRAIGYGLDEASIGNSGGGSGRSSKPGQPNPFSKILNTKYHEGPATFSADGSQIIFTRNNFNEGQKGQSVDNDIKLKLYSAQYGNGDWSNIQELPFNSDEYSTAHPALSKDGSRLYFVSDMPRGVGGKDLYVSFREGNSWSKPVNMGKEINSKSNELFPTIDDNGNLYFSTSGRRGGLGGLDMYYAILNREGTQVIDIIHLDSPLNSKGDDFGVVTDSDRSAGYFSSNRRAGDDDIYRFSRESSLYDCRDLTLRIYDGETQLPLDSAKIVVKSRNGGGEDKELFTDENGRAHLCLSTQNDYLFTASKEGFLGSTVGFTTRGLTDDKPTRLEMVINKPTMLVDTLETQGSQPTQPTGNDKNTGWGQNEKAEPNTEANTSFNMQLIGVVREQTDGKPIQGALVKLINGCTGKVVKTMMSGPDGKYMFEVKDIYNCSYKYEVSKKSYGTNVSFIKKISKKDKPNKVISADLPMLKAGDLIRIDNIAFEGSKAAIQPNVARELDKLVGTMRKYSTMNVEIMTHTDSRGDADDNKSISLKRSQAILDYLAKKGIAKNRMKATGVGEASPINGCVDGVICTEGEYNRNRRTEFKVLSVM